MPSVTELRVNGKRLPVDADPQRPLLSVLRDDLGLAGPGTGCGEGQCGACTVLLNGAPVRSCRTPVSAAAGKPVTTIEGMAGEGSATSGGLHPLQQAFLDMGAFECGYCTSGMLVAGIALLKAHPRPTREEIIRVMDGNICRCGAYPRIIAAIQLAAEKLASQPRREGNR